MQGATIADKVVGKGAAALMIMGGMAEVYANVVSTPARKLFEQYGVKLRAARKCLTSSTASKRDIVRWKQHAERKPTCNVSIRLFPDS